MKKTVSVVLTLLLLMSSLSVMAFAAGVNNAGSTIDLVEENERVDANFGTIVENKGVVGANYATVEKNTGAIDYQYVGTVGNYAGGTITNCYDGSTVYNYGGTIEYLMGGTIYNYGGTIKKNYGGVVTEYKKVTLDLSNAEVTGLTEENGEFWIAQNDGEAVIKPLDGYRFETAPSVSGSSSTLSENADGSYTLSGVTDDITVTATAVGEKETSSLAAFMEVLFMLLTLLVHFLMCL